MVSYQALQEEARLEFMPMQPTNNSMVQMRAATIMEARCPKLGVGWHTAKAARLIMETTCLQLVSTKARLEEKQFKAIIPPVQITAMQMHATSNAEQSQTNIEQAQVTLGSIKSMGLGILKERI
mmetsp:Transcript_22160/g.53037  ORF Transcript_22160/g.53037 Transcript_22160/m.53037 type:complete len:124 (-) Transcript_22160:107-478(-)